MQWPAGCVGSPGYVTSGRRWHRRIPFFHSRSDVAHLIRITMTGLGRLITVLSIVTVTSACALSLRNPHIADLRHNPGRYQNHSVSIEGVVTNSWGIAPFNAYRVDDGTGEVTVVSQGLRTP